MVSIQSKQLNYGAQISNFIGGVSELEHKLNQIDLLFEKFTNRQVSIIGDPLKPTVILDYNTHVTIVWDTYKPEAPKTISFSMFINGEGIADSVDIYVEDMDLIEDAVFYMKKVFLSTDKHIFTSEEVYSIVSSSNKSLYYCGKNHVFYGGKRTEIPVFSYDIATFFFSSTKAINTIKSLNKRVPEHSKVQLK